MSSTVTVSRISFGPLPVLLVALFGLVWQITLTICLGILNCLNLIHLSIAHQWAWVHEWSSLYIHLLCFIVTLLHVLIVVGTDLLRVSRLSTIDTF